MSDPDEQLSSLTLEQRQELLSRLLRQKKKQARTVFPLSFAQQRLWVLDQMEGGTSAYTVPTALRLRGPLDAGLLEKCFGEVVKRHQILRTTFEADAVNGAPEQVIHPWSPVELETIDLGGATDDRKLAQARELANHAAQDPFSLSTGPLLRASLLRLAEDDHILLLLIHHIVSDMWSTEVLTRELAVLYESFSRGEESPLPDLPIQYADFANWQRNRMKGGLLEKLLAYWREQLAGELPTLELPTRGARPARHTLNGAEKSWRLGTETTTKLRLLSGQEDVTLFMTLLAAFKVLLCRYTGQEDVIVGTPIANRSRTEVEGLIGLFINTLVLRTSLSGDPPFRQLLSRVRETALGAYSNQDVPFEKLVEELQLRRDLSRPPIFQVMFALQNVPRAEERIQDLAIAPFPLDVRTAKFDLTVTLLEDEQGLLGAWEYNTDLFDGSLIERMTRHFERLLDSIVANPSERISSLTLLAEAEKQSLLASPHDFPANELPANSLHELFEGQVRRTPEARALTFNGATLTYSELNRRANRLARRLRLAGVGPEVLVGIAAERNLELVVGLLAILKAGGAYVPLDPSYPRDRLAFVLEDARIRVLLTQQNMLEQLPDHRAEILCLDEEFAEDESDERDLPPAFVSGENLAYVIYTSGSTGRPKGVLVTHANVIRLFTTTQRWFDFGPRDVWTLFHSHAFDFSVWELWGSLLYGGRLVVVPYVVSRSPESFYELLRAEGVTVLNQTPSAFRQLMQVDRDAEVEGGLALRSVVFGGEALDIAGLKPWFERRGDQSPTMVNMYGITETTVHVTYRPLTKQDSSSTASVIGVPLPDLQVYVLDRHLQPVPTDVAGEIYVGGFGVSRGYLNRPALAAERFIPDPYSLLPGARLYRTGDSARRLANGDLEYLGRVDQQVKIRGFRIELGEIEATLLSSAYVRDAVVVARNSARDEKQLTAYIVPPPGIEPNVAEVRSLLKTRLPDYMIPAQLIILERIPLTANGKIDRRALPEPEDARPHLEAAFVEPLTPLQRKLADIWAEVLQINGVGIDDNFFELGGDSIRTVQVVSKARRQGLNLSIKELFEYQTVRELADISQSGQAADQRIVEPFALISEDDRRRVPDSVEDAYPLTMLQTGMLFHSTLDPKSAVYHNVGSYHLRAPLDVDLICTAIDRLLARHPVLRTSFDLVGFSEPMQLVHRSASHTTRVEDLRGLSGAEQDEAILQWIEEEKQNGFDWSRGPLLRFHVHRRTENTFQFGMTEHHAILDGWSVASALVELFEIYFSLLEGRAEPPEPPRSTSFRDFVNLEREAIANDECRAYWRNKLAQSTVTVLPRWPRSDSSREMLPVHSIEVPITLETSEGLRQLARSEQIPLKSVLLAAHMRVMSLLSGQRDVISGVVTHGRPEGSDGESALGLFLNTIPFREVVGTGTWAQLAKQAFDDERESMPFRRYQMARIQQDNGGQPLFETVFNYTNFHVFRNLERLGDLEVLDSSLFAQTELTFWANFSVDTSSPQVRLALSADSTRLSSPQLESISGYYARALEAMASNPHQDSSCSLMSERERHQLLVGWNETAADYSSADSIHGLFEAQVERSPEDIALIAGSKQLTYREMNRRANQLARHLRMLGAGPETPVGICAERSADLVVGLIAILKSGAAYLPLDMAYPRERLDFMLNDANASILVTHENRAERFRAAGRHVVCLDSDREEIGKHSEENPGIDTLPQNLSYVIYTSGSTGVPKGVAIEHRSAIAFLNWARDRFSSEEFARTVASTSVCFDLSVFEIFCPLICGGAVLLVENVLHLSAQGADLNPTLINTVPSAMAELVKLGIPLSVQTVNLAGEALRNKLAQQVYEQDGVRRVYNLYGPSEDTTYSTIELIEKGASAEPAIGHPISNTQAFVLDETLEPCPAGVAGQLHIGGEGLARGYLNRPSLTAEKFVPHPFSAVPGGRLYKTGDLARRLPDGRIEFLSRMDHQVKIRGFRIELGEIEAVMGAHPEISQGAVLSYVESGNNSLAGYAVRSAGSSLNGDRLRTHLRERLPDYMVPTSFVFLDALPLTPNGKVDRRELSRVAVACKRDERSIVAPRDSLELQLTQIWESVLSTHPISVTDNFFDMGGHSLLAVRVVAQVRERLKRSLPLSALVQGASIEGLARMLRAEKNLSSVSPLVVMQSGGSRTPFFSVHPIGGSILCYMELARSLDAGRPFYGLEAALQENDDSETTIETIAATYIDAMRSAQSEGPYLLGGWSFGGVVAFEMARQLTQQGDKVRAVVLLDTWAPSPKRRETMPDSAEFAARFVSDIAGMSGKTLSADIAYLRGLDREAQLRFVLDEALRLDVLPPDINLPELESLFGIFERNARAFWAYAPPRPDPEVPMVLFRAGEGKDERLDGFALGWDRVLQGPLEIRPTSGDHYTMLRGGNAISLASQLKEYLEGTGYGAAPAEFRIASNP